MGAECERRLLIESIRRYHEKLKVTDRKISVVWAVLPLIESIMVLLVLGIALLTLSSIEQALYNFYSFTIRDIVLHTVLCLIVLSFIFGLIESYLVYLLVSIRNNHFNRQCLMIEDAIKYIHSYVSEKGIEEEIKHLLLSVEREFREMRYEKEHKPAIIYSLLVFLLGSGLGSIIKFYVFHFLNKDFYRHERREDFVLEDLSSLIRKICGRDLAWTRPTPIPNRSSIIYIALSILTLGLFVSYWIYCIIKDVNNHFEYQASWEYSLLEILETL